MTKKVDINSLLQGISDGTWTRYGGTSWGSKIEGEQPAELNHHCPKYRRGELFGMIDRTSAAVRYNGI